MSDPQGVAYVVKEKNGVRLMAQQNVCLIHGRSLWMSASQTTIEQGASTN